MSSIYKASTKQSGLEWSYLIAIQSSKDFIAGFANLSHVNIGLETHVKEVNIFHTILPINERYDS